MAGQKLNPVAIDDTGFESQVIFAPAPMTSQKTLSGVLPWLNTTTGPLSADAAATTVSAMAATVAVALQILRKDMRCLPTRSNPNAVT